MLIPRRQTPELILPLVGGGQFDLSKSATVGDTPRGTLVCFYRGWHCPACANYLTELDKHAADFADRGVAIVAVSSDNDERAALMAKKIGAKDLPFAYDLPLSEARDWGLFISTSRGKTSIDIQEPDLFSEPGVFLVSPDRSLYFSSVQTMPFMRPRFSELVGALDFVIKNNYPARGEYDGQV